MREALLVLDSHVGRSIFPKTAPLGRPLILRVGRWSPACMVELEPVRAWHPNPGAANPSELVCPVYDTLSAEDFARYAFRPHNAARFVPRPANVPLAEFLGRAQKALIAARESGAYIQDPQPSLYVYGIRYVPPADILETLEPEDRRPDYLLLGLVGSLDIGKLAHGQVALHERTFPDRVAERVALTEATGTGFAPILVGYHGSGHSLNDRLEGILGLRRSSLAFEPTLPPLIEASLAGTTHLLWRIDDPTLVAELRAEARPLRLLILDGHHRFKAAAQRHYDGHDSAPLVMLVDGSDRALRLLPWHRVLPRSIASPELLLEHIRREFAEVSGPSQPPNPTEAIERLQKMRREGHRGFLMVSSAGLVEVQGAASEDAGADFDLLHGFLDETLQIDPEALQFVRSPRAALDAVGVSGDVSLGNTAFLLPGLTTRGVEARAFDRGEVMAQKSTMFLPKVAEGILFAPAAGHD